MSDNIIRPTFGAGGRTSAAAVEQCKVIPIRQQINGDHIGVRRIRELSRLAEFRHGGTIMEPGEDALRIMLAVCDHAMHLPDGPAIARDWLSRHAPWADAAPLIEVAQERAPIYWYKESLGVWLRLLHEEAAFCGIKTIESKSRRRR